jgi:hypothetical protein
MTELGRIIMDCWAIDGVDRFVLYGWAAQLEEGNDIVYASKTTVADFLGVSDDTVLRRTQSLVKAGLMIDTGERKQWNFGWTPVYIINVPKILELSQAQPRKMRGVANCTPPQNAAQGSGSRFRSPSRSGAVAASPATTTTTGFQPVAASAANLDGNREPKTENPKPKVKTCPKCDLPWSRDKGHVCPDPLNDPDDEFLDRPMPKSDDPDFADYGDEKLPLNEDRSVFMDGWRPRGSAGMQQNRVDQAASQKTAESAVEEKTATPTATRLARPPRSEDPPLPLVTDFPCEDCFMEVGYPHHKNCLTLRRKA